MVRGWVKKRNKFTLYLIDAGKRRNLIFHELTGVQLFYYVVVG
jgi:hypothetical protein